MIAQGTILDNTYKVIKTIGAGGGGEIYLAEHLRLEKLVVIKKIKENMKGLIEDRGEADILKRLSYPYLPQVYDFFIENNQVYTIMEYIEGENFQQLIKKGVHFEKKDIIKWGTQLSQVLEYLHGQKPPIIHRDIKPANIILTPAGNICLIDFNVSFGNEGDSKQIIAHSDGYSPIEQYGTKNVEAHKSKNAVCPNYNEEEATDILSPSMIQNDDFEFTEVLSEGSSGILQYDATEILETGREPVSQEASRFQTVDSSAASENYTASSYDVLPIVDERSDIYSMGATLYHLITLKRPAKATEEVIPLADCSLKISDGLVYIVDKAMKRNPEERFQSAKKLHEAFLNIKKLDSSYKKYSGKRDLMVTVLVTALSISVICTAIGFFRMQTENYEQYVAQIESSGELLRQGLMKEAQEACSQAIEMRPEDLNAYIEMVNIYYLQQLYAQGAGVVEKIPFDYEETEEAKRRQYATLWFLAGECYAGLQEYNLAAESYQKAIQFLPEEGEYYSRCAISLAYEGDKKAAEQFLEDAIQKGISDASVYLTKAEIALSGKKYEEAEQLIFKVLELAEDEGLKYHTYLAAEHLYKEGSQKIDDALEKRLEILEEASKELGNSYTLSISEKLANTCYELAAKTQDEKEKKSYYERALGYFKNINESGYKNIYILQNIAIINQMLGRYLEAESVLMGMLESYPEDYSGYMYLTLLYSEIQDSLPLEERDYELVDEYYKKATEAYTRQIKNGGKEDIKMQTLDSMMKDLQMNGLVR